MSLSEGLLNVIKLKVSNSTTMQTLEVIGNLYHAQQVCLSLGNFAFKEICHLSNKGIGQHAVMLVYRNNGMQSIKKFQKLLNSDISCAVIP